MSARRPATMLLAMCRAATSFAWWPKVGAPTSPRRPFATAFALLAALCLAAPAAISSAQSEGARMRAREMGLVVGTLATGARNTIADVGGVMVGHATVTSPDRFRTGVTAVLPHAGNMFREKVPAAIVVGNGFGKLAGLSQVQELGTLETPVLLTGTLNVPRVADALITYMLELPDNRTIRSINPVVGETNDGRLSDIRARPNGLNEVRAAIDGASAEVVEGAVGAGTGTIAFGFKGGIGTSSRVLSEGAGGWTVGVLVQTNYGSRSALRIAGVPVGAELARAAAPQPTNPGGAAPGDGSCMIVVATDAPLDHRALERLGLRALMGMARSGSNFSNGSGDYVIAFSTHPGLRSGPDGYRGAPVAVLPSGATSPLFQAAIEATEEAIYNSLFMATTTVGFEGARAEAIPLDRVESILRTAGALR